MFKHLYPYQTELLNKCWLSKSEKVVMAACCSSGKTIMSIAFAIEWMKENTGRVLILTHGTKVIKANYSREIETYFSLFPNEKDELMLRDRTDIILPQSYKKKIKGKHSLVIVDEGHHYYFAKMVQDGIKASNPEKILILTGTPSCFVGKKEFDIFLLPLFELPPDKISNVTIELAVSDCFKLGYKDLNQTGDVMEDKRDYISNKTEHILEDLLKVILKKIKSMARTNPKLYNSILKKPCNWTGVLKELHKTIFVCNSVSMAQRAFKYFDSKGIGTLISCGEDDTESEHFETFRNDPNFKILVIVQKGVLGYNMSELATIVDLTMSTNLDRLHQLMCRLTRISDTPKLYFKVVSPEMAQWLVHIMSAVLCLGHRDWMSKWNGKNLNQLYVPTLVRPKVIKKIKVKGNSKNKVVNKQLYFIEIPNLKSMIDITHRDSGVMSSYKFAKLEEVREELFGVQFKMTLERALKKAKEYI